MANADLPRGLQPRRHQSSAPFNDALERFYVPATDATALYRGGLVKLAGSADANGVPTVTGNVATGDSIVGVVMGFEPQSRADLVLYRAASTAMYVLVNTDPDVMWEVQEDSDGAALAATSVGMVADLTGFTAGNTTTGRSSIEIDSSTATATSTGTEDVQILKLVQKPDNEIGAQAKWLVRLLNHQYANDAAGV